MTPTPEYVITRATTKVRHEGACVVSLYAASPRNGYVYIGWSRDGKPMSRLVHRVVWEGAHGLIPEDMTVDHICHNRRCVNTEHLRLLSAVDNSRRQAFGKDFPVGWICHRGHPESALVRYKRANRYSWGCSACKQISSRQWATRNPLALKAWAEHVAAGLTPEDPRHGRASTYSRFKCRCDPCKEAHAKEARLYRDRHRDYDTTDLGTPADSRTAPESAPTLTRGLDTPLG